MAEQAFYMNRSTTDYSDALKKMIMDIGEEMLSGVKDGLAYKLGRVENDDAKLHAFIKSEGYDITYKEFSEFIVDAKEIITLNADFIESALSEKISEMASEELSEDDLEQVAGGKMKWWKWLLIGVAAVALVVACVIAGPIVAMAAAAAALPQCAAIGLTTGAVIASGLSAGIISSAAVGAASIAAGIGVAASLGSVAAVVT